MEVPQPHCLERVTDVLVATQHQAPTTQLWKFLQGDRGVDVLLGDSDKCQRFEQCEGQSRSTKCGSLTELLRYQDDGCSNLVVPLEVGEFLIKFKSSFLPWRRARLLDDSSRSPPCRARRTRNFSTCRATSASTSSSCSLFVTNPQKSRVDG